MIKRFTIFSCIAILLLAACSKPRPFAEDDYDERLSGGSMTVFDAGASAYAHAFPLASFGSFNHEVGDRAFSAKFVSAPAPVNPGLGPLYNHVSCISCHVNDGRGKPSSGTEQLEGMLFRCSMDGYGEHGAPLPVSGYGLQLQTRAIVGVQPECKVQIVYQDQSGQYADGSNYLLHQPTYQVVQPYAPIPGGMRISPRMAAPVFGLGLLEAVDVSTILSREDESDKDGDGISGKANWVWDVHEKKLALGRFGWKASQPSLLQQSAGAYNGDMGVTTSFFNMDNAAGQPQEDRTMVAPEVNDSTLYSVAFYMRTLMVPARRNVSDANVLAGKKLFTDLGCAKCHIPSMVTATNVAFPELSNQRIQPYTDLLLHDMGAGLADNRTDYKASGSEWRTAPLWGIGLTEVVNGHSNFLHDGRAKSLEEAILWHGGEGTAAMQGFVKLNAQSRQQLIAFLNSL
ncbi:MAG: di-heme oxidoredictase family protein [Chitinophagales bacterium]